MRKHVLPLAALLLCVSCGSSGGDGEGGDRGRDGARNEESAGDGERDRSERDRPRADREALVGRWSRDADCGRILEFRDDGTLISVTDERGEWSTEPGEEGHDLILIMENARERARVGVDIRGDDALRMTNIETDGATLDVQRCD